jgi:two-component system, NarL family, nitrate/nitrite response regulator NarL
MTFTSVRRGNVPAASNAPVRVVLSDDECLFRASLRQLLAVPPQVIKDVYGVDVGPGFEVVGEAGSGEETVRVVKSVRPDVLLLDLSMPRMSGLEALRELDMDRDSVRTILLAGVIDRQHLLAAVHLGVRGLLLKDVTTELLFEALVCVVAGQYWLEQTLMTDFLESVRPLIQSSSAAGGGQAYGLTPRERQVLAMVVAGHPNKEIARTFSVSEQTIKHHVTRMFDKVGASNRVELAMLATRHGLLDPTDASASVDRSPISSASTPVPIPAVLTASVKTT